MRSEGLEHRAWTRGALVLAGLLAGACGGVVEPEAPEAAVQQRAALAYNEGACEVLLVDGYGNPIEGHLVTATLYDYWADPYSPYEEKYVVSSQVGVTDDRGYAYLPVEHTGSPYYPYVECSVDPSARTPVTSTVSTGSLGWPTSLNVTVVPYPTASRTVTGLQTGNGVARLYQSGAYDRVVVLAEPFDTGERTQDRGMDELWELYNGKAGSLGGWDRTTLVRLYQRGYDVWLVQAHRTGDSLHEQAAEFAQGIQHAIQYGPVAGGKVTTFGFSLGGLVNRIATARWSWDVTWRSQLGLQETLPVNLIVTGDSPLRGAQVNQDLQYLAWKEGRQSEKNFDSCSAQQMLQTACHRNGSGGVACDDEGWYQLYVVGGAHAFINGSRQVVTCQAGPPVLTQGAGGNGWAPGVKRIAWTQGTLSERTGQCYGDATGKDRNSDGLDICPRTNAATFEVGHKWMKINAMFGEWDENLHSRSFCSAHHCNNDDLEPGSKHDTIFSGEAGHKYFLGFRFGGNYEQYTHAGTFIPSRSSLDRACATCAITFDDYWHNSYNSTHTRLENRAGRYNKAVTDWLIEHLEQAHGGGCAATGTCPGTPAGAACGELTCVKPGAAYVSHFTGPNCDGDEYYYTPYFSGTTSPNPDGIIRPWDGQGLAGKELRTVAVRSAKDASGQCYVDQWPSGNSLTNLVRVYRAPNAYRGCGEASCRAPLGRYFSHFTGPGCDGDEYYYTPYFSGTTSPNPDGVVRSWDGQGQVGTQLQTVAVRSARDETGYCYANQWPSGNALTNLARVYRLP